MNENVVDASLDDLIRLISGIVISVCALLCLLTNLTYIIACYRGRKKFGNLCYYSATRCLSECAVVLSISQLSIITPSIILVKWKFDIYQDSWLYEAVCILHNVSNIGAMLFVTLMTIESLFSQAPDRPLFEQRYAMDILCWCLYCLCLAQVAIATIFQSFHHFSWQQLRFYNSYVDTSDISVMVKCFLDWERFVGLSLCFVVFWWKRNANNTKSRNTSHQNGNQKRIEYEAITDCFLISILCLIAAAAFSILPEIFRFNTNGNIRFIASVIQSALESLLPSIIPLINFYFNPKARQVLKQMFEDMHLRVPLFRRRSTDSIVIFNP